MNQVHHCPNGVLFRLSMCALAIVLWITSEVEPRTVIAQFSNATNGGAMLTVLLGVLGMVGAADILVNDVLDDRFTWRLAKRNRHFILIALAFCYTASMFVSLSTLKSPGLTIFYGWAVFSLISLAFVDAYQRKRKSSHDAVFIH